MNQEYTFHIFDGIVLAVLAISALVGLSRGIVREVLGIGCWVVAFFAAIYAYDAFYPFWTGVISNKMVASVAAYAVTFIGVLSICLLLSSQISRRIDDSELNSLDRSLGLVFGLTRGAVIICLGYLIIASFHDSEETLPDAIKNARTVPLVQDGVQVMLALLPDSMSQDTEEMVEEQQKALEELKAVDDKAEKPSITPIDRKPAEKPVIILNKKEEAPKPAATTYDSREQQRLEQLIESVQ